MTTMLVFSTLALLAQAGADGKLDASQFSRVLAGLHSPIRDFELICEGEYRVVKRDDPEWADSAKQRDLILQSNYAYRSDGRAILDAYEKLASDNAAMSRRTYCLVDKEFTSRNRAGSLKPNPAFDTKKSGDADSIDVRKGSPGRFNFLLFWNRHLARYPDLPGYQCEGWEKVDGHDCLKVIVEGIPEAPGSERMVFWMDMKRDGHALKHEMYHDGVLWYRKHNIQLAQFKLPDGASIWFPIRGEFDTHTSAKGPSEVPIFHEVESVVQGSVAFNQGLPDERFTLDWNGRTSTSPGYQAMAKSFAGIPKKDAPPPMRRDPVGVAADQKEKLAKADQESAALDASASSQRSWFGTTTVQALLTGTGILALIMAYLMRSRLGR